MLLHDVLLTGVDKINPDHPKCNPFAYFTQIAYNIFRQKIKNEKRYGLTKEKFRKEKYDEFELTEGINPTQDNPDEE